MKKAARRKEQRERRYAAEQELNALLHSLASAYSVFDHTADPELLEASILEICALKSRYSSALKGLKLLEREAV